MVRTVDKRTNSLKLFLRDQCIAELARNTPYFSLIDIRSCLKKHRIEYNDRTVVKYLHDFVKTGTTYNAGRGWYSSLAEAFSLDTSAIQNLVAELEKAFPLVSFSCWSTAQIQAAMHHLLGKFVSYVMVDAESMQIVWEYLRDAGWDAHLNPRGKEAERFYPGEKTVIIRQSKSKSPSKERFSSIEVLLVELYFETRSLNLMAEEEYRTMVSNLAGTRRINMALLLSYTDERKLVPHCIIDKDSKLIPPNNFRRN
jgi:hypothetical protein